MENIGIYTANEHNRAFLEWTQWLLYDPKYKGIIELPPFVKRSKYFLNLIERVYPYMSLAKSSIDPNFFRKRLILTIRNSLMREINHILIDRLPRETTEYLSVDKAELLGDRDGHRTNLPNLRPFEYIISE